MGRFARRPRRVSRRLAIEPQGLGVGNRILDVPETWTPDQIASYQKYWDAYFEGYLGPRRELRGCWPRGRSIFRGAHEIGPGELCSRACVENSHVVIIANDYGTVGIVEGQGWGKGRVRHLAQLRSGTFSYGAPKEDILTLPGEPTAAIYAWALCLPAVTIGAISNVMHWLQRPLYRQADIFARPGTIGGMRFMRDTGFVASAFRTPDLFARTSNISAWSNFNETRKDDRSSGAKCRRHRYSVRSAVHTAEQDVLSRKNSTVITTCYSSCRIY